MIVARQFTAWECKKMDPSRRDGMIRNATLVLVSCPINTMAFAGGQLAVFQGASEVPISEFIRHRQSG